MMQQIKDTTGPGILLWLIGYLASLVLFFSPFAGILGWILIAVFTPVTIAITWWWFRARDLSLAYYAGVGIAWVAIAVVLDYLFIVLPFQASYYGPDVFVYYVLTFLIPAGVGLVKRKKKAGGITGMKKKSLFFLHVPLRQEIQPGKDQDNAYSCDDICPRLDPAALAACRFSRQPCASCGDIDEQEPDKVQVHDNLTHDPNRGNQF